MKILLIGLMDANANFVEFKRSLYAESGLLHLKGFYPEHISKLKVGYAYRIKKDPGTHHHYYLDKRTYNKLNEEMSFHDLINGPRLYDMTILNLSDQQLDETEEDYVFKDYYYKINKRFIEGLKAIKNSFSNSSISVINPSISVVNQAYYSVNHIYEMILHRFSSYLLKFPTHTKITIRAYNQDAVYFQWEDIIEVLGVRTNVLLLLKRHNDKVKINNAIHLDFISNNYLRQFAASELLISGDFKLGFFNNKHLRIQGNYTTENIELCTNNLQSCTSLSDAYSKNEVSIVIKKLYDYRIDDIAEVAKDKLNDLYKDYGLNEDTKQLIKLCPEISLNQIIGKRGYDWREELMNYQCYYDLYAAYSDLFPYHSPQPIKCVVLWSFVVIGLFTFIINWCNSYTPRQNYLHT